MSPAAGAHRAVIEAGPGTIRRLCCGTSIIVDDMAEVAAEALGAIDDRVALVGGRPVAVGSLWRAALRSLICADSDGLVVVHPSWWPSARVAVVTAAATVVADGVVARPRTWLLAHASHAEREATVVVEIAERLVVITGAEVVAIPRGAEPQPVAEEVATAVAAMTRDATAVVLVDAPGAVAGAPALASSVAGAVRGGGRTAIEIGDARLPRLARSALPAPDGPSPPRAGRARMLTGAAGAGVVLAVSSLAVSAVPTGGRHGESPLAQVQAAPTTFLVEGRVALTVPANWPTQRVVAGPGSARVQVTSPSDPEVALHVTQSPVAGETLSGTAERLKHAIDAEPAGVFVDFNPSGTSGGRPAVTYREVRAGHHVRWTVLLDGPVRISVGCQSRPGGEEAVRDACEQAVRSAHAIG
ncbi:type VII secretion-associated protein [Mycobacterium malmoense]|uniref:type VII secretion-associated protein n=1 Tax=Mycobacterium malmoense TaxID=1780 RepID=UPI0008F94E22|nr:type VII secretion-associated protein [Mycobacterium malmoense]OIN79747.1 type VII secretion-associated protein [Mycobacterium malmoense]